MDDEKWPDGFVSAEIIRELDKADHDPSDVTMFNDDGVRYITGGERSQEYLYMEGVPPEMENRC